MKMIDFSDSNSEIGLFTYKKPIFMSVNDSHEQNLYSVKFKYYTAI